MPELNRDILYLIFEEFQCDNRTLHSCLLINRAWCEIIILILWKNPWKYLMKGRERLLLSVILSHLSDELKDNLRSQGINFSYQQRLLFDYISFCRHLNLIKINGIIHSIYEESKIPIIQNEILKLFINENTKFTHLYIPQEFDNQIHLIPGSKHCFSELEFLHCYTSITDNALTGLTELCQSIKELELITEMSGNNYGIVKLIETSKKLYNIHFQSPYKNIDESFHAILEKSLIKHANTIQYFKINQQPVTNILSYLANLKILELMDNHQNQIITWNYLKDLSLPFLRILGARSISTESLTSLIENTKGNLTEIKIYLADCDEVNNKKIIQAIYGHCPNLKYLKLLFKHSNISELEKLLINCQYLNGLFIFTDDDDDHVFDWDNLFEILTRSSPISLFKFKFFCSLAGPPNLGSLKLFLDNWKGKHPMFLQINIGLAIYSELLERYKREGIVKKYDYDMFNFEEFEWIQKKFIC